jgi:hypothetical protein
MSHISEIVGIRGAFETLRFLEASSESAYSHDDLCSIMERCGVELVQASLQDFVASNLLHQSGSGFALSTFGIRTSLLLEAVNGTELRDTYRRLARLDTSLRMYELIREGMTKSFFLNLQDRPGFGRLYICSPWINLDRTQAERLSKALSYTEAVRGTRPEILVMTRPEPGTDAELPSAVDSLRKLGASVFLNKRLHTKLYIREPDTSGGYAMAIVGSQNLTRSSYVELGIRINSDSQMIDQLIAYFLELTNYSHEVEDQ